MIEIAQTHKHLIADVLSTETQTGQGAFWWLGQHTFIVKVSGKIIYIDPWFAPWEARQTPTLLDYSEGQHADIVLVTHGHGDHLCPETLKQMVSASPNAIFVCPRTEAHRLREEAGVPDNRIRPIDAGGVIEIEGAKITAIKSISNTAFRTSATSSRSAASLFIMRAIRSCTTVYSRLFSSGSISTRCSCQSTGATRFVSKPTVWAILRFRRRQSWRAN